MFECSKQDCHKAAEWEPELVIANSDPEVRIGIPAAVCTPHRRGLRALLLEAGVPGVESVLAERGVDLHATAYRIEFTALN